MPVTLALIKPEALKNGYAPAIEATIEAQKFSIIARAEVTLLPEQAAELYEEFAGTALFAAMCAAVTSGPIVALAIDKADAQAAWSELIGPADPAAAREEVRRYLQPRPALATVGRPPPPPPRPPPAPRCPARAAPLPRHLPSERRGGDRRHPTHPPPTPHRASVDRRHR